MMRRREKVLYAFQLGTSLCMVIYYSGKPFFSPISFLVVDAWVQALLITCWLFVYFFVQLSDGRLNSLPLNCLTWSVWHIACLVRGPPAPRRPIPGAIGALPVHAWSDVVDWLSGGAPETRRALLELRATSRDLHALVAARGHVGRLRVGPARTDMLEFALVSRAAMGQSLLVEAFVPESYWCEAPAKRLLWEALRRGHRVSVASGEYEYLSDIEGVLAEAARRNLLVMPRYRRFSVSDAVVQHFTELHINDWDLNWARLKEATSLRRVVLERPMEAIDYLPRTLRELHLVNCLLEDLSPVACVPKVVVRDCNMVVVGTDMHNDWLEFRGCQQLWFLSLPGPIGRLVLADLPSFKVSSLTLMKDQPPRTLVLEGIQFDDISEMVLEWFPHVIRRGI